ncbi:alpha/beta fold hydrolase [Dactylosporangium sp. AC04546]|uniref:alpha/beta hydrolase n=1 Tax=Dactylosporangium sp. AC04546 TaxID=2862460 RepID=UPI001EDDA506|nr:alpha/beta fold hydrolase [Dactylosporangium sp. AC04546]WVK87356.1 alpha/beta fold hydrolase [Dactylosporangium sp. AC04546]
MSTEVRFPGPDRDLAGTLTVPDGPGPFPAALLIPGSGPVDRDSNHGKMGLGVTAQLADALTAAGYASLRYDKRGVAASRLLRDGSTEPADAWKRPGLHDNAEDAAAALAWLAGGPEVDRDAVFLIGHSEGAILAAEVAADPGPVDPAGVVLLSCPATPGDVTLRWQATMLPASIPAPVRILLRLLRVDLVKSVRKNHERIRRTTTDTARLGLTRVNARWVREFLDHDPATDLARLTVPTLAITGSKDLQTNPDDLGRIAALVAGPVETWLAPDLSHLLRAQPGPASLRAYRKEIRHPVDPGLLARVTEWLARHRPAPAR